MKKNKNRGFSLVEILIVASVVAVLCVALVLILRIDRQKMRDARRISDVKQIQVALEMHYNDENFYPAAIQSGAPIAGETSRVVYMNSVPGDPLGPTAYGYNYVSESPHDTYSITFRMESNFAGFTKGIHRATTAGIE